MKRGILALVVFLFVVMFSYGVLAEGESCYVTDRAACEAGGYAVMGLSGTGNAHGELLNQSNYNYVLCCNFAGSTACNGNNTIIKLSSVTNAHAEIPTETTYLNNVCYGELNCISTSQSCASTAYPMPTFSLSSFTNAHIGSAGSYPINICCSLPGVQPLSLFWSSDGTSEISSLDIVPGTTSVKAEIKGSGLSQGTNMNLSIFENDPILDDYITSVNAVVGVNGSATAEWTVTMGDLQKTSDYAEFYFEMGNSKSNYLSLNVLNVSECNNIVICSDYSSQSMCQTDTCGVSSKNPPLNVSCNGFDSDCFCEWSSNKCGFGFDTINTETNITIGTCVFDENSVDDCSDGFLSYSWVTSWTGNPEDKPSSCADGSRVIECPAQVQLPFFGIYNVLLSIIIIIVIYLALNYRKTKRGKRRGKK